MFTVFTFSIFRLQLQDVYSYCIIFFYEGFQRRVLFRLADLRQQVSDLMKNTPIIAHRDVDEELAVKKADTLQEFTDTEELLKNVEKRKRVVSKTCQLLNMTIFTYIMYHVSCINNIL